PKTYFLIHQPSLATSGLSPLVRVTTGGWGSMPVAAPFSAPSVAPLSDSDKRIQDSRQPIRKISLFAASMMSRMSRECHIAILVRNRRDLDLILRQLSISAIGLTAEVVHRPIRPTK